MKDRTLFRYPVSGHYWRLAVGEFKSLKVLIVAALLTALRIAVKSLSIPIMPGLKITFGFIFNAAGSMIYGPVVAVATSAISDTLGAIMFPSGPYFFPYIFEEIAGGVLFALWYYRTNLSTLRVILGRLSVTVIVNFIISPVITIYYYEYVMGKSYVFFSLPRIIKNLALFPVQSLILVLLFRLLLPITNRQNLTFTGTTDLRIQKKDVIWIIVLTVVSAMALLGYFWYQTAKAG
ncbi:MAG: folate family ECF transporter S component [Lachnospiraceae bacterium]|nr:folate family ECF transporter S component [Lachnospiraceae bacterium]